MQKALTSRARVFTLRVLTVLPLLHSYFDIKRSLPRLAALHSSSAQVLGKTLWFLLVIQIMGSGIFLALPYLGRSSPELIHFGWRKLSDYSPKQRDRIMPLLGNMAGWMGIVFSSYFATRIHLLIGQALSAPLRTPAWWPEATLGVAEAAIILYYLRRFDAEALRE